MTIIYDYMLMTINYDYNVMTIIRIIYSYIYNHIY